MASGQFSREWTESIQSALPMRELCWDTWSNYNTFLWEFKIHIFCSYPSYAFGFLSSSSSTVTYPQNEKVEQLGEPQERYCAWRLVFILIICGAMFGTYSLEHPSQVPYDLAISPALFWQIHMQTKYPRTLKKKKKRKVIHFIVGSYSGWSHEIELEA